MRYVQGRGTLSPMGCSGRADLRYARRASEARCACHPMAPGAGKRLDGKNLTLYPVPAISERCSRGEAIMGLFGSKSKTPTYVPELYRRGLRGFGEHLAGVPTNYNVAPQDTPAILVATQ